MLTPPSPLNEDGDNPRSGVGNSAAALAAAASLAEGNGITGVDGDVMGDDGVRLPESERLLVCTQVSMKGENLRYFVDMFNGYRNIT